MGFEQEELANTVGMICTLILVDANAETLTEHFTKIIPH
jgi:hypothetical protein